MMKAIKEAGDRGVTMKELVDIVYGDDPQGGPLSAANVIRTQMSLARHKYGKPIKCEPRYIWG